MDMEWRDANIVPKYHEAGLTKFAFHMPAGMPLIGTEPAPEGFANYPTGCFGTRRAALEWLAGCGIIPFGARPAASSRTAARR